MIIDTGHYRINVNSLVASIIEDAHREMYMKLTDASECNEALWALSFAVNGNSVRRKLDLGIRSLAESSHGFYGNHTSTDDAIKEIVKASEIKKRLEEVSSAVKCALRSLPGTQRKMIYYFCSGKSLKRISSLFGKNRKSAIGVLQKALVDFQKYLYAIGIDAKYLKNSLRLVRGKSS